MNFFTSRTGRVFILAFFLSAAAMTGCHRPLSAEQKHARAELSRALRDRAYEKALPLARQIVAGAPHENGAWDRLVRAEIGLRDFAAAKQTLPEWRKAVRKPSPKMDEYAGDLALEEHDSAGALSAWTTALAGEPRNTRVLEKVARLRQTQAEWSEADDAWTAVIRAADSASARLERATCRRRLHHWTEAFDDFHRAQEMAPNDPDIHRVAPLFDRLGKFADALRDLDSRLAVAPNDSTSLADRALLFLRSEDFELALEDARSAMRFAPAAVRPKLFAAISLLNLGRAGECEQLGVRKSLRLDRLTPEFLDTISRCDSDVVAEEKNAELYVSRAWQLDEIGQPALALDDAEAAGRLDPNSAPAAMEAAYALRKLGRAEEALSLSKHATELDPNLGVAWQYRGELESETGDRVSAVDSLSRAIAISPSAGALQKREECYRGLGLLVKAEQDHQMLEQFRAGR